MAHAWKHIHVFYHLYVLGHKKSFPLKYILENWVNLILIYLFIKKKHLLALYKEYTSLSKILKTAYD